jgi:hypothetical protein
LMDLNVTKVWLIKSLYMRACCHVCGRSDVHTFLFGPEARHTLPASAFGEWWLRLGFRQP